MVRFFLNGQTFNNPADWEGFSTSFKRDYDKRIISVQYSDTVTFTGGAYRYIDGVQKADGYCAEISIRVEEQCGNGPWQVMARGKIIMADCEFNETRCSVQCSVVDNGIGARVANNKKVPVSPLSDLSKNNVSITPAVAINLTMFTSTGGDITGTRRVFDWFDAMEQALAYITDGEVTIVSDWYAALPDDQHYAVGVVPEIRTAGFNVPRIAWTFDDLFTELSKKHNLWLFATEDAIGNPYLRLEPESYFLGDTISATILNIQDLIRKTDTERLYATVDVGSDEGIVELGMDNPLPFVVLLGFSRETFQFSGVCNTDATLDLVNKWIIDTNQLYQIVQEDNDEWDNNVAIIQYTVSTSKATQGTYLFANDEPYLYNEELISVNVLQRFRLPSAAGANYAPGFNDSFLAQLTYYDTDAAGWLVPDGMVLTPYQTRYDNDYDLPGFDINNVWGNGTTPGTSVLLSNSRFTPTAQGVYVFGFNVVVKILFTYPYPNNLNTFSQYAGAGVQMYANVYDAADVLISSNEIGITPFYYLIGSYPNAMSIALSLAAGQYVTFISRGVSGPLEYDFNLGAPFGPSPNDIPLYLEGKTKFIVGSGSTVTTEKIISGGVVVPTERSLTEGFTFDRSLTSTQWLQIIQNPGSLIAIDGNRQAYPLELKRSITGSTTFELIKQP